MSRQLGCPRARRLILAFCGSILLVFAAMPRSLRPTQPVGSGPDSYRRFLESQETDKIPKPLQNEVTVTLKLIQVVVTDKKGNPVTGLKKEDFVIYDNGKRQTLTEFESHELRVPAAKPAPADESITVTPTPASPLLDRKFFLFFDYTYTDPDGARKAAKAAVRFIDNLLPSDEVAVVCCTGMRRLEVREFLTRDHDRVRRALGAFGLAATQDTLTHPADALQQKVAAGASPEAQARATISDKSAPGRDADGYHLAGEQRWLARNFMWALETLAQALRYISGQKTLILFSEGIPGSLINREPPSKGLPSTDWRFAPKEDMNMDLRNAFTDLCRVLATANIAVFPVQTTGPNAASEVKIGAATLREMAEATGGRYFANVYFADKHLNTIQTLTATYYVVGYPISATWDGKYHEIRVEVARPGCQVRAQAGYFNPKPFASYSDVEKLIDLVDLALAERPLSQAPVRFAMQAQPVGAAPAANLAFIASVPVEELGDVAGPKVEVQSLIFDRAENIIDSRRVVTSLSASEKKPVYLFSLLSVPPGKYKCRIVLRNAETGRAAVAGVSAVVPEKAAGDFMIYPPLFLAPGKGARYIGDNPAGTSEENSAEARLAEIFLLDSGAFSPSLEKTIEGGADITAAVRISGPGAKRATFKLASFLVDSATSEQVPVGLDVIKEKNGKDIRIYLIRLHIPEVEPDIYGLHLVAEDTASGAVSHISSDFTIVKKRD